MQAELLLSDRIVNLVEDGIDVAVRIGVLPDSGDVVRKVGATRRVLVASPEYCARRGTPLSPAELARHDTIAFTGMSHRAHVALQRRSRCSWRSTWLLAT